GGGVSDLSEEFLPAFGDGLRILDVLRVQLLDPGGVGAIEEGGIEHGLVASAAAFASLRLDRHFLALLGIRSPCPAPLVWPSDVAFHAPTQPTRVRHSAHIGVTGKQIVAKL